LAYDKTLKSAAAAVRRCLSNLAFAQTPDEQIDWLTTGAEAGSLTSMALLPFFHGYRHQHSRIPTQSDVITAANWARQAFGLGHRDSGLTLAALYCSGMVPEPSPGDGVKILKVLARAGHHAAEKFLEDLKEKQLCKW
jgi:hypothetical protein